MCSVSMVADHYADKWRQQQIIPQMPGITYPFSPGAAGYPVPAVSRQEFDTLKHDVEEMKAILKRAKAYDEANNEPDCEIEEKMDLLRKVAQMVGVDLDDVIGKGASSEEARKAIEGAKR